MKKAFIEFDKFFDDFDRHFSHTLIGTDSLVRGLRNSLSATIESYPPYNIIKLGDDEYQLQFALAGFSKKDVTVTQEKNILSVESKKQQSDEEKEPIVYRGIATRSFIRTFGLAEYIKVETVTMENGLLTIALKRVIPEEDQPREFKIK